MLYSQKDAAKSEAEIYSKMYYDECIKPLVMAEAEAGNIATSGRVPSMFLTTRTVNEQMDAEVIAQGIDDLPIIFQRFARLIKQKTYFVVSFMFAGPDPRNDRRCHPSETPEGNSFAELYQTADSEFLTAFQQYAEQIFPANKHKPDAKNEDGSSETHESDNEQPEEHTESLEGEEDEPEDPNAQSVDVKEESQLTERKDEGDQSMGMVGSEVFLPIPDASMGTIEPLYDGQGSSHAMYGTQGHAMYDMQAHAMYNPQAHAAYNPQAHATYEMQAHPTCGMQGQTAYDKQGTSHASLSEFHPSFLSASDASLQSQGPSFQMQTGNYAGFSTPPSNLLTPGVVTPGFSFSEALQDPNWTDPAWNFNGVAPISSSSGLEGTPRGSGWRLLHLLSPISTECSSQANEDSLPAMPSPKPSDDSRPVLPSPDPIPSMDNTSCPSITKPAQKCPNVKSSTGLHYIQTHTTKNKQPLAAKPLGGKAAATKPATNTMVSTAIKKPSSNPIANVTSTATNGQNASDGVAPSDSSMNDTRGTENAIGTDGVSFFIGKESVCTEAVEGPSSLKRSAQNEAPSTPKKKQVKA
ncbi:hypothetical protein DFH29DRAFT_872033 [Suillus ampliporus]|nr:hypothetical protein DFH29DRAFT_872033 [Suillus ampliporus]